MFLTAEELSAFSSRWGTAQISIEESGPVRATIRVSGWHEADPTIKYPPTDRVFQYIARVHVWRGKPCVRVLYTFINDIQHSRMAPITEMWLRCSCAGGESRILEGKSVAERVEVFQVDEKQRILFRAGPGRRESNPADRCGIGWAAIAGKDVGVAVGLREFWQNWPKEIQCGDSSIGLYLCPRLTNLIPGLYDDKPLEEESKLYYALRRRTHTFKVGVAKTHEFWVNYFAGKPDAKRLGEFFRATEEPLLAMAEPAHTSRPMPWAISRRAIQSRRSSPVTTPG